MTPTTTNQATLDHSRACVRDARAMVVTPADVKEYPNSYVFIIDLSSLKSGDIKVRVEDENVLMLSGERKNQEESKKTLPSRPPNPFRWKNISSAKTLFSATSNNFARKTSSLIRTVRFQQASIGFEEPDNMEKNDQQAKEPEKGARITLNDLDMLISCCN
ncbi:hypothetical protein L6452_40495 [Arctium lappa]|uniref:Uncharacterized protein n=1 Tax=Arctium lappa TaxID=4217 RepID=A0ACB8XML6_ARCLA|nr:hypothetical protein L6452_40495 [Arctium lappa]